MFTTKSGLPLIITNLDKLRVKRMPEISDNFKRSEFACKCGCGFDTVDAELVQVLEVVRFKYNSPVHITSGCRCDTHNKKVGGSDGSKHKLGIAADIVVEGVPPVDVYRFLTSIFKSLALIPITVIIQLANPVATVSVGEKALPKPLLSVGASVINSFPDLT